MRIATILVGAFTFNLKDHIVVLKDTLLIIELIVVSLNATDQRILAAVHIHIRLSFLFERLVLFQEV
jgi:hypothetical protein